MAYFIETELEARVVRSFTSTSPITTTQIGVLATAVSNIWDGLNQQASAAEGDNTTAAQYVKEACLAAASYMVNKRYNGEQPDDKVVVDILKSYMRSKKPRSKFHTQSPDSTGSW